MHTIILLIGMSEYSEGAVIQRVQILGVRHSGDLIIVPLEEAGLHGRVEAGEHFVLADAVDERRVRVGTPVPRVGRVYVVVAVFGHLQEGMWVCTALENAFRM